MLPFAPLRGHIRRPDLRNHRKLLVVDGREAYIGSHNLVAPDYDTPSFQKAGITYDDTSVSLTGRIVTQIEAVFALDWYYACKEVLTPADLTPHTAREEDEREDTPASSEEAIAWKDVANPTCVPSYTWCHRHARTCPSRVRTSSPMRPS